MILHHLTVNSGHLRPSPRAEVDGAVIDRLLPLVDAGGGALPVPGWWLDVWRPRADGRPLDGALALQIAGARRSREPWAMAVVCWRPAAAAGAWDLVTTIDGIAAAGRSPGRAPLVRPASPWLAVAVLPWAAALPDDDMDALADAARCVGWAAVES